MTHRRIPKRRAVMAGAGAAGLIAAAVLLPRANASQAQPEPPSGAAAGKANAASAAAVARGLAQQLGDAFAGSYYDAAKQQVVVNIAGNNSNADEQVKKAGAVPRAVRNSAAELRSAAHTLARTATIPGTAWAVDPRTNRIVVSADRTVQGAQWTRLEKAVRSLGADTARIQKSAGQFKPFSEGGDAIFGGGARCSLGFNVTTQDGQPGFITAGHCGVAAKRWSLSANGAPAATVQKATFPGNGDFSLLTYDDAATEAPSAVDTGAGKLVEITGAADASVGERVLRMGSTTGLHDGKVTGLDATVNYPEGTVTGLIRTDVCAEPGDSGGSLFTADGSAVGLTSGGSGNCTAGGETFFQPVTTALAAVGATIGAGGQGSGGADASGGADGSGQPGNGVISMAPAPGYGRQ
ncbi:S1 family peptidase [Streptomyces sp. BPTC-684]|uniref:S1 family peptidase n=1 Tax=Streptomyces sp. BPTC-684 TaxID=3043734 RepID=UPI0024B23BFD|nr:S1 family peptidase [Streptomyces sp. BPTC-684]WHM40360.1 S1 family peptidase [Streptomyces sp. BPTC-684]